MNELFEKLVVELAKKKHTVTVSTDNYNHKYISMGTFTITDMKDCVNIYAPNFYINVKDWDSMMLVVNSIR